jgi:hypothetical protein
VPPRWARAARASSSGGGPPPGDGGDAVISMIRSMIRRWTKKEKRYTPV